MVREKWLKKIPNSRFELSSIGGIFTLRTKERYRIILSEQAGMCYREYFS